MMKRLRVCSRQCLLALPLLLVACTGTDVPEEPGGELESPDKTTENGRDPGRSLDASKTLAQSGSLGFSATPLGEKLQHYHDLLDSEEQPPSLVLGELRREAGAAAREVVSAYRKLDVSRGFERWKLVHTLGLLKAPEAVGDLAAIAGEPVAARPKPARAAPSKADVHTTRGCGESSQEDTELMIRARAVEGLARLAYYGNADAERELLALVKAPALSARRAAVQAYLYLPGDRAKRQAELEPRLANDDLWMLSIRAGGPEDFKLAPTSVKPPKADLSAPPPLDP